MLNVALNLSLHFGPHYTAVGNDGPRGVELTLANKRAVKQIIVF